MQQPRRLEFRGYIRVRDIKLEINSRKVIKNDRTKITPPVEAAFPRVETANNRPPPERALQAKPHNTQPGMKVSLQGSDCTVICTCQHTAQHAAVLFPVLTLTAQRRYY